MNQTTSNFWQLVLLVVLLALTAGAVVITIRRMWSSRHDHHSGGPAERADTELTALFPASCPEDWASDVLAEEGVHPTDTVRAVKAVRTADRRLSLLAAKALIDRMRKREIDG